MSQVTNDECMEHRRECRHNREVGRAWVRWVGGIAISLSLAASGALAARLLTVEVRAAETATAVRAVKKQSEAVIEMLREMRAEFRSELQNIRTDMKDLKK